MPESGGHDPPLTDENLNLEYLKMKKIALATAAVLTLTGAAFAENPNVGGQDINTIAQKQLDSTQTSSIGRDSTTYKLLNAGTPSNADAAAIEFRQSHFGNR